jgi:hypothetical protein
MTATRTFVFILLAHVLASACILPSDPGPPEELGLSISADGVIAYYNPCAVDRLVTDVTLFSSGGKVGRTDDTVIWSLHATTPILLVSVVLGSSPVGFATTVPLKSLPTVGSFVLEVARPAKTQKPAVAFQLEELRAGSVLLTGGRYMATDAYLRSNSCKLAR